MLPRAYGGINKEDRRKVRRCQQQAQISRELVATVNLQVGTSAATGQSFRQLKTGTVIVAQRIAAG